jgi:hypothetical protein
LPIILPRKPASYLSGLRSLDGILIDFLSSMSCVPGSATGGTVIWPVSGDKETFVGTRAFESPRRALVALGWSLGKGFGVR